MLLLWIVLSNRRLAQASEIERARLVAILDTIDYGVYQTDDRGIIRLANPPSEVLTGYAAPDVIGRDLHHVIPHTDGEGNPCVPESCPWVRVALTSGEVNRGLSVLTRKEGTAVPVEIGSAPILSAGRPVGSVIVFQEISERLRQEHMKDDFLGFASHELRSPLTTVYGWSRWLANKAAKTPEAFDEDTTEAIQALEGEARRMGSIIELFLDLTRIQMDRLELNEESVDLVGLLRKETAALRERYPEIVVHESYPEGPLVVHVDEGRFCQAAVNLLENAVRYGGEPPAVVVSAGAVDGRVSISVVDNGVGISAEDQAHIFERFYRGEAGANSKGLGIGLFLTSAIVRRLGGTITAKNNPEGGAEFTITLPS